MGGLAQFFDLHHQANRKVSGHRRHDDDDDDGSKAPRNSLEFPMKASQDYHDDIPVKSPSPKLNMSPSEAPKKTIIDEELFNRPNNRRSAPSVVARLMGMDKFPAETKPIIHAKEYRDERVRNSIPKTEPTETFSDHYASIVSTPFRQAKQELLPYTLKPDSGEHARNLKSTKPQPREHPQEELLQKFKKEFEAWQSSKVWEHSRTLDFDTKVQQVKDNKTLAQENLNKEKLARYAGSKRNSTHDSDLRYYISKSQPEIATRQGSLQNESYNSKQQQFISKGAISSIDRVKNNDHVHLPVTKLDKSLEKSFSSTRIVILKPSSEGSDDIDGSLVGSSKKLDKEGTMQDFLEEVKERLKKEIQGKITVRGIEMELHFTEKPPDPKQIARHITKQIKENVTTDLRTALIRSESTRSYGSEIRLNEPDSPELISRDTRKLLSDKMENVLKNETKVDIPLASDGRSRASLFTKEGMKLRPVYDFSEMGKKVSSMKDRKVVMDSKTRSFRRNKQRTGSFDTEPASPRNLVRSFSAPVSGTAFGKLLLEDQHVLTGAHIRRKQEASEYASVEVRKSRKDGFNLKDTVSSLRHNFGLKGKLFRKKIQVAHELAAVEFDPMKITATTPSVLMNFGTAQENFTEVPPSPATVSSYSFDDFCKRGHPSPDSTLEVPFIEDHPSSQVSGELNSKFPEPNNLSEQVPNERQEVTTEEPYEDETLELEDHPEAYARKILITAGMYEDQAFAQAFSKSDLMTRPIISKWVFEKVEEIYSRNGNADEEESYKFCGDTGLSRKMLFDLMNEAFPRVLKPPTTRSTFKDWVLCPDTLPLGRQLLGDLMHHIRPYIDHQVDESHSLESKMAWDLKKAPWPTKSFDESEVIGRKMECFILRDLIDELVLDMCS